MYVPFANSLKLGNGRAELTLRFVNRVNRLAVGDAGPSETVGELISVFSSWYSNGRDV